MWKLTTVLLAGAAFGGAMLAAAHAQGSGDAASRLIERLDSSGDGAVGLDEFVAAQKQQFAAADSDGDGFVTEAELTSPQRDQAKIATLVQRLDTDGDGRISSDEAEGSGSTKVSSRFSRLDADADGFVTAEELSTPRQKSSSRLAVRMIKRSKTADESRISLVEAEAISGMLFKRIDANSDGAIDATELAARHGQ